jgi:2-oxoglutarate dehydrogenase E1 component
LANIAREQASFEVHDSLLSEMAVLGFEYGYSVNRPEALVLWEAQFGDFVNGAQIIIDQFISSAEEKWRQKSGIVLLLPHGYEGQGPEHSSARLERFLTLCARGNIQVAYPSTPAQYFHLLRRQVRRDERKPLVVLTPKSLLRQRDVISTRRELSDGSFQEVVDDAAADPARVTRLILCSGKVYYDLAAHRAALDARGVALVRVEQFYPYPADQIAAVFERYGAAGEILWVQEEPRNMGAWDFLDERLLGQLRPGRSLRYVGRPSNPSPAAGSYKRHLAEQRALVEEAFEGLPAGAAD